jgi:peptidyl-prolyl cis-trans isomerase B (cyclophilin B)
MIQGGDPDSKIAKPGQALGEGNLKYRVEAEFRDSLFHKKGVLAAARDNNPQKESSASQFYIVQGKKWTDTTLDEVQLKRMNGRIIPESQRKIYKELGGSPHLDQNYTVYGEVISGIEMIDSIADLKTGASDRPVENVSMMVSVLRKGEARKIEKKMNLKNNTL